MPEQRKSYDHRLKTLVCRTRDLELAARLGVPRATAQSWIRRGVRPVTTCAEFADDQLELAAKIARLERRVDILSAVVGLLLFLVKLTGAKLDGRRVPEGMEAH